MRLCLHGSLLFLLGYKMTIKHAKELLGLEFEHLTDSEIEELIFQTRLICQGLLEIMLQDKKLRLTDTETLTYNNRQSL